jgi:hypothetical protein
MLAYTSDLHQPYIETLLTALHPSRYSGTIWAECAASFDRIQLISTSNKWCRLPSFSCSVNKRDEIALLTDHSGGGAITNRRPLSRPLHPTSLRAQRIQSIVERPGLGFHDLGTGSNGFNHREWIVAVTNLNGLQFLLHLSPFLNARSRASTPLRGFGYLMARRRSRDEGRFVA